jgi:hypothetical protein
MKNLLLPLILLLISQNVFSYSSANFMTEDELFKEYKKSIKINTKEERPFETIDETYTFKTITGSEEVVISIDCPDTLFVECYSEIDANSPYSSFAEYVADGGWAESNCGIDAPTFTFVKEETVSGIYHMNIRRTYSIKDSCKNTISCGQLIVVNDTTPPEVVCRDLTIQLDENAQYILETQDLIIGSYDVCGIDTLFLDKYELDCDNIGTTFITATAIDVNDNMGTCIAELTVYGNIAPNVLSDTATTVQNVSVEINIVSNDYDIKTRIDTSTLNTLAQPSHGSIEINSNNGTVTYTPDLDFLGTDSFTYSICDDAVPCGPMCGTALVFIDVVKANSPPVVEDDYYATTCFNLFSNNILTNDSDPNLERTILNITPIEEPVYGEITLYTDGTFYYIPDDNYIGIDSFVYEICCIDLPSMCNQATVYIEILSDITDPKITCPPDIVVNGSENIPNRLNGQDFLDGGGNLFDNCNLDTLSFSLISEFLDTTLFPDVLKRTYYVADKTSNEDICLHQITIENATQLFDFNLSDELTLVLFPNPNNGVFTIEIIGIKSNVVLVEMFNNIGEKIIHKELIQLNNKITDKLDMQGTASGVYFIKIENKGKAFTKKFIIE